MEGGKLQNGERTFFLFFAFHFSKPLKFVLGLTKWEFSTGKKHFTTGKKSGKMTLPPLKNIPLTPLLLLPPFCITLYLYYINTLLRPTAHLKGIF